MTSVNGDDRLRAMAASGIGKVRAIPTFPLRGGSQPRRVYGEEPRRDIAVRRGGHVAQVLARRCADASLEIDKRLVHVADLRLSSLVTFHEGHVGVEVLSVPALGLWREVVVRAKEAP